MKKNDWIFSGIVGTLLIIMVLSNIYLLTLFLGLKILYIFIYVAGMAVILLTMTHYSVHQMGNHEVIKSNWIKNHLIFWMMTDIHTLIMIARYVFPKERQGGYFPELLYVIHLLIIIPVYFSYRSHFYKKYEVGISFCLHALIYTILSYNFIQFIIQTMQ